MRSKTATQNLARTTTAAAATTTTTATTTETQLLRSTKKMPVQSEIEARPSSKNNKFGVRNAAETGQDKK